MQTTTKTLLLSLSLTAVCASGAAHAQSAPSMQWGAMDLQTSQSNCLGRARKPYFDAQVERVQNTGWQVYGEKSGANVIVSCAPATQNLSHLLVIAASSDPKAAEALRNDVRARIARMVEFDH